MSSSNCYFLTCIPISQEAGKLVWCSHLLKNFPQSKALASVKQKLFFVSWVLNHLFHSLLLLSSRGCSYYLSAIRVVSSAYLRLLIFILKIFIPACASSSLAFLMMYSPYKLNKQGDNIQPCRTPFPILNQSFVPCKVLTVASCNMRQVTQEAGKVVWYFHLFKNSPQFVMIHTVKGFREVNEAEADVFLEFPCLL